MVYIKVKDLNWQKHGDKCWIASALFGTVYSLRIDSNDKYWYLSHMRSMDTSEEYIVSSEDREFLMRLAQENYARELLSVCSIEMEDTHERLRDTHIKKMINQNSIYGKHAQWKEDEEKRIMGGFESD